MYEHPQNVLLLRLINANLDLLAVHKEVAVEGQSPGAKAGCVATAAAATALAAAAPPSLHGRSGARLLQGGRQHAERAKRLIESILPSPAAEEAAQAQLGKSLRLWLDLQNSLNALVDSNAGAGAACGCWAVPPQALSQPLGFCSSTQAAVDPCGVAHKSKTTRVCHVPACALRVVPAQAAPVRSPARRAHHARCRSRQHARRGRHQADAGEEGGAVPQEHDGQARQLCGAVR